MTLYEICRDKDKERAFRNSDKQSISELKWLPLLPKLSLFSPGKSLLHWLY